MRERVQIIRCDLCREWHRTPGRHFCPECLRNLRAEREKAKAYREPQTLPLPGMEARA